MNHRSTVFVFLIFLLGFLSSCAWFSSEHKGCCSCAHKGTCSAKNIDKSESIRLRLVNVLDKELFDDAHIAGLPGIATENIAVEDLAAVSKAWDRAIPVVVYCSNYFCSASSEAASLLKSLGFEQVFAYEGGMAEWYQLYHATAPELLEGPAQQDYLKMVVQAPEAIEEKVGVITASELQNLMKTATLS